MKVIFLFLAVITFCFGCNTKKEAPAVKKDLPAADMQIKLALLAAPQEKKDSCTVYGYGADKELILLRKGSSGLSARQINSFEPFLKRMSSLSAP